MAKKKHNERSLFSTSIREQAEELLRTQPSLTPTLPTTDVQALVHELNVHQMELEVQNEELRQAQMELSYSRDRYSDLYEFAPVGYVTLKKDGTIVEANLTAATLLGVDRKYLVGANITHWLDHDSQDTCYLHRQAVFSSHEKKSCEITMHKADGTLLGIRMESIALGDGDARHCRTALVDETEVRKTRKNLEESEQRYRRLTESVTDYIYRVLIANGQPVKTLHGANCEAITGYKPEEFDANPQLWNEMVPEKDHPIVEMQIAQVLDGKLAKSVEHRIRRKNGEIFWVLNTVSPQYDQHGHLIAYDGLLHDITKRKNAENVLSQLNESLEQRVKERTNEVHLLAEAMASLGEGVMITSDGLDWPGPEIVYVNEAMCRISGYTADELIGQKPRLLQGPLTDEAAIDLLRYELRAIRSHLCELILYRKDGSRYHAEQFVTPILASDGKPSHYIGIHRDITQRKETEEELRSQHELNESIINTAQNIILLLDKDGRIILLNHFAEELTGWKLEEVQGCSWFEIFIPEAERDSIEAIFERSLSGEPTRGFENSILTKDGRQRQIEWFDAKLKAANGEFVGLLCSGRDITERKLAEDALRQSEERLRAILQTAADAIITINRQGIIEHVNLATARMFGYTREELRGQNVKVLMPYPYSAEHDGYIQRYLKTGIPHIIGTGREVTGLRKDGSTFPASLVVSQVDHIGLFTGIIHDNTERKLLQQHVLQIASEEQRRIGQDLHDGVGQELTGLGLIADTLSELTSSSEVDSDLRGQEVINLSRKLASGLKRTLKQVRSLSRGLVPVQIDPEGLSSGLRELASHISELYGINCHVILPAPVAVHDSEAATHLYRIAQEATTNAIKHGKAQNVTISLRHVKNQISLEIEDDGTGFVGDPLKAEILSENPMRGVGLRIMQHRAWLVGGHLAIDNSDNGGVKVSCIIGYTDP